MISKKTPDKKTYDLVNISGWQVLSKKIKKKFKVAPEIVLKLLDFIQFNCYDWSLQSVLVFAVSSQVFRFVLTDISYSRYSSQTIEFGGPYLTLPVRGSATQHLHNEARSAKLSVKILLIA